MSRPYNNRFIQSNDNLLISIADPVAVTRQLRKLALKKVQLEKRKQHLEYLFKQCEAQIAMVDAAIEQMGSKDVSESISTS